MKKENFDKSNLISTLTYPTYLLLRGYISTHKVFYDIFWLIFNSLFYLFLRGIYLKSLLKPDMIISVFFLIL